MKFDWEDFMNEDNNIAVHCKTEEEANDFCRKMAEHGMRWNDGNSYIEDNSWYVYEEITCYANDGTFSDKDFLEDVKYNYKILEWSDYMDKDPIDYLEYGYVVEFENGEFAMFMPSQEGDCFDLDDDGCCYYLENFDDKKNLKVEGNNCIIKIYGYTEFGSNSRRLTIGNRPLIWERPKEVKKMTVSEICKELGYKVEIVEG